MGQSCRETQGAFGREAKRQSRRGHVERGPQRPVPGQKRLRPQDQTDRQTDVRSLQITGQGWAGVSLLSLGTGVHQIGLAGQGFWGEGWRGHLSGPKLRGHRDEREKSSVDGTLELCVRLVQFWIRGFGDLEWSLLEGLLSVVVPSRPHISPTNKIL